MIWGPFVLALALGLIVSAGLYFAYLWPHVEPDVEGEAAVAPPAAPSEPAAAAPPVPATATAPPESEPPPA